MKRFAALFAVLAALGTLTAYAVAGETVTHEYVRPGTTVVIPPQTFTDTYALPDPVTVTETSPPVTVTVTQTVSTSPAANVIWQDDFSGSTLDSSKWWKTPWCSSSGEDSQGCYNAANVSLDGAGHLRLRVSAGTMGRTYDFARVQTFREGGWPPPEVRWSAGAPLRVEASIKFPAGAGLWGAFWPMGVDSSTPLEYDIQEFRGKYPSIEDCHFHRSYSDADGSAIDAGANLTAGFHTYWMELYADHVVFGVDGKTCGNFAGSMTQKIGLRLSNVVGPPGTWGGDGGPPPASSIPADMLVDYVRVSRL